MSTGIISVIIPTLNERACIKETLQAVTGLEGVEVIVVDGGSKDDTLEIARPLAHRAISAGRGRAIQMNAGAGVASGEILFFLHADCLPPEGAFGLIRTALNNTGSGPRAIAGAFDIRIDHGGPAYRLIEKVANLRSRLTGVPYGDQGFFISRSAFESLGGFNDMPIMEDIEMGRRVKGKGSIEFIREPVLVSPRRWLRDGIIRTTLRDWALALAYTVLRVSPDKLAGYYRDAR